jgi:hypothetical protein
MTTAKQRYRLINSIERLRMLQKMGRYDKPWQVRNTRLLIAHFEQRLREL